MLEAELVVVEIEIASDTMDLSDEEEKQGAEDSAKKGPEGGGEGGNES